MNESNDEIIIGVNIPKDAIKKKKEKKKKEKKKKEVAQNATSKEKKTKARITGNTKIFRNRFLKKLVIIIFALCALFLFLSSSFFNIKEIVVENNERVSTEEIISLIQLKDKNIFSINTKNINKKLAENAYIENVSLKRNLPNKITLNIEERKIKYMIQLGEAYVYINNQGYILEKSSESREVPILVGIVTDVSNFQPGNRLDVSDLTKIDMANRIVECASNNGILPLISKIDISNSKNYTLYLESERKTVYLGDCSNLNTRILYVNAIIEQESGIEGEIFVNVDLNTQNVYFREKI